MANGPALGKTGDIDNPSLGTDARTERNPATRPLRLLLLNYEYPPVGGGAGNATQRTAIELAGLGHTVDVLTASLRGKPPTVRENGITVYRVASYRKSIHEAGLLAAATYLFSSLRMLRQLSRQYDYDVFHFYFGLPTGLLGLYVRWWLKKPYVIALRGSDVPGYDQTRGWLRPLHALLRPLTRYLWGRAATTTALSRHLKELAVSTAPRVPIRIVGNGVDSATFPRKQDAEISGPLRLLTVCRLVKRKGLDNLIAAMSDLAPTGITLQIVGSGEQEDRLKELVESLGLTTSVEFVGYVPREELAPYYRAADLFVLPSLAESFGLVLLEAMSCGLPIVATKVGGIPDIVDPAGGRLVEPGSAQTLARAIKALAGDSDMLRSMGRFNAQRAREEFGWSKIATIYEGIYQESVGVRQGGSSRAADLRCSGSS